MEKMVLIIITSEKEIVIQEILLSFSVMIQQINDAGDGLVREWPTPRRSIDVHRSYALQWFAFALLIAALYVYFGLRRDAAGR